MAMQVRSTFLCLWGPDHQRVGDKVYLSEADYEGIVAQADPNSTFPRSLSFRRIPNDP